MKTLDEVIKTLEKCIADDAIESEGVYLAADALHYLKEYQKIDSNWSEKAISELHNIADANFLRAYREDKDELTALRAFWKEQHENAPLTWDELKAMEGKPVWVECKYFFSPQWVILTNVYDEKAMFIGDRIVDSELKEEMGDVWQAYRKERI